MRTAFEQRRRDEALRRARRRALVVAAAVGPVALAAGAAFSPVLDVDTVRVSGTTRIAPDAVRRAAAVARGEPIATVDTATVERRVAALRGVKSVTVSRAWPSGIAVRVVERVPVVAVPRRVGSIDLYDADGVFVDRVASVPSGTPRLAVAAGAPSPDVVTAAVELLRALPPELRSQVRDLRAAGPGSLAFSLSDGAEVVWGSGERTPEKVYALGLLARQHAKRYDLRVPDRPAVVPR